MDQIFSNAHRNNYLNLCRLRQPTFYLEGEWGNTKALKTPFKLWNPASFLWVFCNLRDWCAARNRREHYVEIIKKHLKKSDRWLKFGHKRFFQMDKNSKPLTNLSQLHQFCQELAKRKHVQMFDPNEKNRQFHWVLHKYSMLLDPMKVF